MASRQFRQQAGAILPPYAVEKSVLNPVSKVRFKETKWDQPRWQSGDSGPRHPNNHRCSSIGWPIVRPFHTPEGVTLEIGQAGRRHRYIRKAVIEAGTPTPEEVNLLDGNLLDKIEHFLVV